MYVTEGFHLNDVDQWKSKYAKESAWATVTSIALVAIEMRSVQLVSVKWLILVNKSKDFFFLGRINQKIDINIHNINTHKYIIIFLFSQKKKVYHNIA